MPPARRSSRPSAGPAAAGQAGSEDHQQSEHERKQLESAGHRPAPPDLQEGRREDGGRQEGLRAAGQQGRARSAILNVDAEERALATRRPQTSCETLRDTTIPKATKGKNMSADVGGTTAGYVDLAAEIAEPPDHHDRRGRRAQLHAADAGLPLDRDPADRGADEPDLDRRGLRRGHRGVREGLGREPGGARRRGPDRLLRAADDVRDPLRPVDGLRGVPDDAHQGGVAAHAATTAAPSSRASPPRAASSPRRR